MASLRQREQEEVGHDAEEIVLDVPRGADGVVQAGHAQHRHADLVHLAQRLVLLPEFLQRRVPAAVAGGDGAGAAAASVSSFASAFFHLLLQGLGRLAVQAPVELLQGPSAAGQPSDVPEDLGVAQHGPLEVRQVEAGVGEREVVVQGALAGVGR